MTAGASKPIIRVWGQVRECPGGTVTAMRPVRDDPDSVWIIRGQACVGLIGRDEARQAGLGQGSELDESLIARIDQSVRARLVRRDGTRMLAARSYARRGLADALVRKGHDRRDAEAFALWASDRGYIDDTRFAETVVRNELARRPAGRRLLESKLRSRGVAPEDAAHAIDKALGTRDPMEDALDLARAAARSLSRRHEHDIVRRRIIGRLARRGFSGEIARRAAERAIREAAP